MFSPQRKSSTISGPPPFVLSPCRRTPKDFSGACETKPSLNGHAPGITLEHMIACTDVHYTNTHATAACILFHDWSDAHSDLAITERVGDPAPYEPGRFYRRELPPLLSVISKLTVRPEVIIIDGYVWLGDWDHPGLGAHLHKALGGSAAVIGVAKELFRRGPAVQCVRRGSSARPLYVSAAGMDLNEAATRIVELHGEFRVPTLLKRADRLCRGYQDALESGVVNRSPTRTSKVSSGRRTL
jgi:deoxyribonuclease V